MATSNKRVLILLGKLALILLLGVFAVGAIAVSILGGEAKFGDTYQSVIQRKYEKLKNTEGPKILVIGGSNVGFGFDAVKVEEETGWTVTNMGLHAGFGHLFNTEIAKNYIGEGDIVLLAYEYGLNSTAFEKMGEVNLIMKAIDNKLEMYREIPLKNMPEILGNLFKYAKSKAEKQTLASGIYSSASFDAEGNMIATREKYIIKDYADNIGTYGVIDGSSLVASEKELVYLKELKEFIENRGASVYFVAPVLLEDAYRGTEQNLLAYAKELERITGIQYISNPFEYVFPSEYMYDTIYHCNDKGEEKRTELVIKDLRTHGIVN